MKNFIVMISAALVIALVGLGVIKVVQNNRTAEANKNVGLEIGNQAPDLELIRLDGKQMKLSELRGKKVMLNFWATWCPPCKAEMPEIEKFYEANKDDIEIVAISNGETKQTVDSFIAQTGYTFPIYLDQTAKNADAYKILSIPTTFFIDSKGIIQAKQIGSMTPDVISNGYSKLK